MVVQGDDVIVDIIMKVMKMGMFDSHNVLCYGFVACEVECATKENNV